VVAVVATVVNMRVLMPVGVVVVVVVAMKDLAVSVDEVPVLGVSYSGGLQGKRICKADVLLQTVGRPCIPQGEQQLEHTCAKWKGRGTGNERKGRKETIGGDEMSYNIHIYT
jgi:hypothetical protein